MTSIFKKLMFTRKASYKLSESLNIKVPFKLIIKPFKNTVVVCIWSSFSYLLSMINRVPWTKLLNSKGYGCEVKQCHLVYGRNSCKEILSQHHSEEHTPKDRAYNKCCLNNFLQKIVFFKINELGVFSSKRQQQYSFFLFPQDLLVFL